MQEVENEKAKYEHFVLNTSYTFNRIVLLISYAAASLFLFFSTKCFILPLHVRHFITWSFVAPAFIIPFTMYFSQTPIM